MSSVPRIVLASTSPYRVQLLRRLVDDFEQIAPGVDEATLGDESPDARAARLAESKARAVAQRFNDAIVIGSDQVAEVDGRVLDKPGTPDSARLQLTTCSGRAVRFHTALCVIDVSRADHCVHASDLTRVFFRDLSSEEIARYVERERPFDCAGGFKAEALGIALFERVESQDPTALIGLPLIALARLLRGCGLPLP